MASIHLEGLTKAYGPVAVVAGLDLQVAAGERCVLLGPSGCGKTTTLRMVAGLESPDRGRILLDGEPVVDAATGRNTPPERRGLGMVFQSYALWPHLSVRDNVAYPLARAGTSPGQQRSRVDDALATVQLPGLADRMPHALSGGQQQRVALARALVARPRVLLMDEPMSNLDARLRDDLRADIAALCAQHGITLLHVTHDQAEAMALGTLLCVMHRGRMAQVGPPQEVYARPRSLFVATFLGDTHVLDAHVRADGGARVGDVPVEARMPEQRVEGAPLKLAVRPEDVQVAEDGPLRGRVRVCACVGSHWLLDVETPAGNLRVQVTAPLDVASPVGLRVRGGHAFSAEEPA
jgi:ABC-type Fe3+/spermidine/putrescine transport system ATPase subunit